MKKSLLLVLFLLTCSVSFADMETESWRMNRAFYESLKTCTDYHSSIVITYNNENNTEIYDRSIKKIEDSCFVAFSQSASSKNPPADAGGTVDVYKFPMNILPKINKTNFDKYAKKYYDEEHSL